LLIAVRFDLFVVEHKEQGDFFVSSVICELKTDRRWDIINVYGPVQYNRKDEFLAEITEKVMRSRFPVCLGGDFNIIRYEKEKSSGVIHRTLMYKFNTMIDWLQLWELHRSGGRFTRSNKQSRPTMEVLDRVLVSADWEAWFPLALVFSLTRAGSDHCPIFVDLGNGVQNYPKPFRMEPHWFSTPNFVDTVMAKWPHRENQNILDF
jgi:exonuclease III